MPKIKLQPSGKKYSYSQEKGESLLDILLSDNLFVDNPCGGKGLCGKCRVRMLGDDVPAPTPTEEKLLSVEELARGIRLACLVKPEGDLELELLQKAREGKVLTGGYTPDFAFDPPVVMDDADSPVFGVALDIGTTTVVCTLVNMRTGEECGTASMVNAQKHFGLDVLTRITYELEHPEDGVARLQQAIVDSINEMIADTCQQAGIQREDIHAVTVAANCTMMHMLLGVDATSIGRYPYTPVFVEAREVEAVSVGIHVHEKAKLYCLPGVSSYIGADIVAGTYVCQLEKEKGNVLFIDIGTNGEIVLSRDGQLICCSCAAGPALEGMNIRAGMRAADGAIEEVRITESGVELRVIGDEEPVGICGSGILSVVKELVKHGIVTKSGAFIRKKQLEESDYRYSMIQMNGSKREFILTEAPGKLVITQGDIRQVQLAKGAILSGFLALLNRAGISMADLDKVIIAGQFGAHLPEESITGTGILPREIQGKLTYVGNSSKTGAYMALMSRRIRKEMEALATRMEYVELGQVEGYERLFSECLLFPEVQG